MTTTRIEAGIAAVAADYDGFIVDLWGVLHNGTAPYPGALEALAGVRAEGRRVCLLSNAPRRVANTRERLRILGITDDHYEGLMTSGELAHTCLADPENIEHRTLGPKALFFGGAVDRHLLDGVAGRRYTGDVDAATWILNTGIADPAETVADYYDTLSRCAERSLPMVCVNPDLVVITSRGPQVCAGAIAEAYESMGAPVIWHGKPHQPVYDHCRALMGWTAKTKLLAIGDSFRTDVAGALGAGCDVAFIAGGIHRTELSAAWGDPVDPDRLTTLTASYGYAPTFAIPAFRWMG
jgi:HAD superfamily hydrolase (TIGR01459 family)